MLLHDALNDFVLYLRHEQGAALTTRKGYGASLREFLRWMQADGGYPAPTLTDFCVPTLKRYLYHLGGRGLRPRTVRSKFHALKAFGAFLVGQSAMDDNPAQAVTMPKKDAARRVVTTDDEVTALLEGCDRIGNARRSGLAKAIISVLAFGALRRQELLDLRLADVNLPEKSLLVRCGKGSKSRKVFICQTGIDALREWIALRGESKAEYLFLYDRARRISQEGLRVLVEDVKACAGLKGAEHIKPHSIRHNAATRLLRNGANIRDVQQFLGHTDIKTTAMYLHTSEEQLRSVAELTSIKPTIRPQPASQVDRRDPRGERLRRIAR